MIIPLWVLLIPAALIVTLVLIFALINVLQVFRFGFMTVTACIALAIFFVIVGVLALELMSALGSVDWQAPLVTFNIGTASDIIGQ